MNSKETRDRENKKYFVVGIPFSSGTIERLEQDAKQRGVKYITEMIAIRVADYYQLMDSLSSLSAPSVIPSDETTESTDTTAEQQNALDAFDEWPD